MILLQILVMLSLIADANVDSMTWDLILMLLLLLILVRLLVFFIRLWCLLMLLVNMFCISLRQLLMLVLLLLLLMLLTVADSANAAIGFLATVAAGDAVATPDGFANSVISITAGFFRGSCYSCC